MGMQEAEVYVKGPGPGRESAIRAVQAAYTLAASAPQEPELILKRIA